MTLPSIAKNNTELYRKDMWRGPAWTNINYLTAEGLERYGYHNLAKTIIKKPLREQEKWYFHGGTFFEFYDERHEAEPKQLERKGVSPDENYHPFYHKFRDYG